jgi:predicted pyridoxine 5'-phosphate oxidase superfamily flavin-nucleotide-binding protein
VLTPTFHAGERALQTLAGSQARLSEAGPRVVRDHMPDQHREFFGLLPFLLAGSVDPAGQPWASVLTGPAGFVHSPHEEVLRVDALPAAGDPLHAALHAGAPLGLLGIQPHTRRRNRMNGTVASVDAQGFTVHVGQSFGNCPKYIVTREASFVPRAAQPLVETLASVDDAARRALLAADTFFIASAHPQARTAADRAFGVDVSHRGGPRGFLRLAGDTLLVPDYVGNAFFNTLGNLQLEPRCGVLLVDYARGDTLQLAARAELVWEGEEVRALPGAQRLLKLHLVGGVRTRAALPLVWREYAAG